MRQKGIEEDFEFASLVRGTHQEIQSERTSASHILRLASSRVRELMGVKTQEVVPVAEKYQGFIWDLCNDRFPLMDEELVHMEESFSTMLQLFILANRARVFRNLSAGLSSRNTSRVVEQINLFVKSQAAITQARVVELAPANRSEHDLYTTWHQNVGGLGIGLANKLWSPKIDLADIWSYLDKGQKTTWQQRPKLFGIRSEI